MANRIIYPASLYPLSGDVSSTYDSNYATVTGFQAVPLTRVYPLSGGTWIQYNPNTGQWQPMLIACIQVNGITVSLDYEIAVNSNANIVQVNGVGAAP